MDNLTSTPRVPLSRQHDFRLVLGGRLVSQLGDSLQIRCEIGRALVTATVPVAAVLGVLGMPQLWPGGSRSSPSRRP